jgi:hypothetical protein
MLSGLVYANDRLYTAILPVKIVFNYKYMSHKHESVCFFFISVLLYRTICKKYIEIYLFEIQNTCSHQKANQYGIFFKGM